MSEWKEGAARRRDARATKDEPNVKHPPRKNTRRWCKGKVGVEHVVVRVEESWTWGNHVYSISQLQEVRQEDVA